MEEVGIGVCHIQNSLITIAIRVVLKWLLLKHYTEESAGHHSTRVRWEKVNFLVQRLLKRLKGTLR
jgi:hypothetical protein